MKERESYSGLLTVSGLLAGFSFTSVIGLLALDATGTAYNVAFVASILATFLFLMSTLGAWATLEWISERANLEYRTTLFFGLTLFSFVAGLLAFVSGVVATAFMKSPVAGLVGCIAASAVLAFFVIAALALSGE